MKESVEKYKTFKTPEEVNLDRKNYTSEELEKMYNFRKEVVL